MKNVTLHACPKGAWPFINATDCLRLRTARLTSLLALLALLGLPARAQAQFDCATNNGTITISGYTGSGSDVDIPSTFTGLPVTGIGNSAFNNCTTLISITIPESVTRIGDNAFSGCTNLETTYPMSGGQEWKLCSARQRHEPRSLRLL